MKRKVLLWGVLLIAFLMVNIFIVVAEEETSKIKIDKAYDCLTATIENKTCGALTLEQKIFSLLSVGKCKEELINGSKNNSECWPKGSCKLKETAQSILALSGSNINTDKSKDWILSQKANPRNINWYLEIESPETTNCTISHSNFSSEINIGENKKITSTNLGSCFALAYSDYWIEINPDCYDKEFEISCDKSFLSTLIFKKQDSSTYQLLSKVHSESAGGTTTEKINSFCFEQGTECNYEGSLWAVFALDSLGEEVSSYIPYLIVNAEDNEKFLPESFLYYLTNDPNYKTRLLSKQKSSKYWLEDTNKFYDTALALYPFKYLDIQEKTQSINWLLEVQEENGCWKGGIRNTGFILYSIWSRPFNNGGNGGEETSCIDDSDCLDGEECIQNICVYSDNEPNCEDEEYFCMSSMQCNDVNGTELDYNCDGAFVCCDTQISQESCEDLGGEICSSDQTCTGTEISASDTSYYETCCSPIGSCKIQTTDEYTCVENNGTCRTSCENNEESEWSLTCEDSLDECCMKKTESEHSYWFVWLLLILIFLVVLAVIFKDKVKEFWFKLKLGSGKLKPESRKPRFPFFDKKPIRNYPRRILPKTQLPQQRRIIRKKNSPELDSVLKKLKDISK